MNIIQSPSPNFSSRKGTLITHIVIHCTDGNFPYDLQYLQNPNPGSVVGPVSAHYVVAPNGDIHQLVDTFSAAWHAGRVNNPTAYIPTGVNPNLYSIGIETSVHGNAEITDAQKASLKELLGYLSEKFGIPLTRERVIGHREIYSLKTCPGLIDIDSLLPEKEISIEIKKQQISILEKLIALFTLKLKK